MGAVTADLFADIPHHLPDELSTTLLDTDDVRIERIVSHGHASPKASGTTRTGTSGLSC